MIEGRKKSIVARIVKALLLLAATCVFLVAALFALVVFYFYYIERVEGCVARSDTLEIILDTCRVSASEATLADVPTGYVDSRFMGALEIEGSTIFALNVSPFKEQSLHVVVDPTGKKLWYVPSYE